VVDHETFSDFRVHQCVRKVWSLMRYCVIFFEMSGETVGEDSIPKVSKFG